MGEVTGEKKRDVRRKRSRKGKTGGSQRIGAHLRQKNKKEELKKKKKEQSDEGRKRVDARFKVAGREDRRIVEGYENKCE